jgi:hypothetical protein
LQVFFKHTHKVQQFAIVVTVTEQFHAHRLQRLSVGWLGSASGKRHGGVAGIGAEAVRAPGFRA